MNKHKSVTKVCFATGFYGNIGGVAKSSARVVNYLIEEGFEVHVVTSDIQPVKGVSNNKTDAHLPVPYMENGAKIYKIPLKIPERELSNISYIASIASEAFYFAIQEIDNSISFDIFHGFYFPMAYPCILVASKGKRPVIASIRGDELISWSIQPWGIPFIHMILQRAHWITSVNSELLEIADGLSEIADRSSCILNSIEMGKFLDWRLTEHNLGVVGTVGRFSERKDIRSLIQAYSAIDHKLRNKLLLVGDFPEEKDGVKALSLIEKLGLKTDTQLTGFIDDHSVINDYLRSMRVFVMCSKAEGLPNALLEAAAIGVPLIATNIGGVRDLLRDGDNAILVPPGDPNCLAHAIQTVLKDAILAEKLSQGAKAVAEKLRPENEKREWIKLYEHLSK